jgi:hypothetical protein
MADWREKHQRIGGDNSTYRDKQSFAIRTSRSMII